MFKGETKSWRKILYEDQGFPDNYVPDSFLSEMTKNKNVRLYSYWELVFSSVVITQQLSIVCIFILSWWYISDGTASPGTILFAALLFCSIGYIIYVCVNPSSFSKDRILNDCKTAFLLMGFTAFFSPVLETLTHTISTDTIYIMSTLMLFGHFLFHDYDIEGLFASRSVSLNMSVFAAVCLASRLNAVFSTFVTVVMAFLLFGLWPPLRRTLWKHKPFMLHGVALFMYLNVFAGFYLISYITSLVFLSLICCITFVLPALLLSMQSNKNNISGPWDEAVISD